MRTGGSERAFEVSAALAPGRLQWRGSTLILGVQVGAELLEELDQRSHGLSRGLPSITALRCSV